MTRPSLPCPHAVEEARALDADVLDGAVGIGLDRPERPTDRHDGDQWHEDAQLGLHQRSDDREDGRALGLVAPQRAQGEQHEDDPDRVDLPPHDIVEPEHRVDDHDHGPEQRDSLASPKLADHRPDEVPDRQVGEDGRDLDEVADAAERIADGSDQPQDVQVSGRVVVEEVALVEAVEPVVGEVVGPESE